MLPIPLCHHLCKTARSGLEDTRSSNALRQNLSTTVHARSWNPRWSSRRRWYQARAGALFRMCPISVHPKRCDPGPINARYLLRTPVDLVRPETNCYREELTSQKQQGQARALPPDPCRSPIACRSLLNSAPTIRARRLSKLALRSRPARQESG